LGLRPDRQRIDAYLDGREGVVREVDAWIRRELEICYPVLRTETDDICQTVHAKLLVNLRAQRFHYRSTLKTYVCRIAHHAAIDGIRRRYRERPISAARSPETETTTDNPYRSLAALEEQELINQVLLRSPAACRELWGLVFLERLSYDEVGRRLTIPEGTVKSRMFNCRRKARALLERLRRGDPRQRSRD